MVKTFKSNNIEKLEEMVNEFIKDKEVVNIQYSSQLYHSVTNQYGGTTDYITMHFVFIYYK